jgi:hypothetical protein
MMKKFELSVCFCLSKKAVYYFPMSVFSSVSQRVHRQTLSEPYYPVAQFCMTHDAKHAGHLPNLHNVAYVR